MNSYESHLPTLVLIALTVMGAFVMWRAQKRSDFDWGNMLKDDDGKESAVRLGILVSLSISTWWVVWMALHNVLGIYEQALYLCVWSGTLIAKELIGVLKDWKK